MPEIKTGSIVKLRKNAVYYDGSTIPPWVMKKKWIVSAVEGERAVIDKSKDGTRSICSAVNVKYLMVAKEEKPKPNSKPQKAEEPKQNTKNGKTAKAKQTAKTKQTVSRPDLGKGIVSMNGVNLVAEFEGCRLTAYKCPAGVWTIGYGHTAGVKQGDVLASKEEAKKLLLKDLSKYADYVNQLVKNKTICFQLTQNQFDALTSFVYNCGMGSLTTLVNGRNAATVADKLLLYNKGGGQVLPGLTRRRQAERKLFLKK